MPKKERKLTPSRVNSGALITQSTDRYTLSLEVNISDYLNIKRKNTSKGKEKK